MAGDQYGSVVNNKTILTDHRNIECSRTAATLFGVSVFYDGGVLENDNLEEGSFYVEFGEDPAAKISIKLY